VAGVLPFSRIEIAERRHGSEIEGCRESSATRGSGSTTAHAR